MTRDLAGVTALAGVITSVALRTSEEVQDVTGALSAGRIVRGYPMPGTVFVTSASDLRWMKQLCASPAIRAAQKRRPALGLDDTHVTRAQGVLISLTCERSQPGGGTGVPRAELFDAFPYTSL
ncbi:DNA glycosylase AlkZ-like family protein [Brevibacterium yomogidense]|uniref:DNA glycosylase AlkZ-like family protein n=1 Tax=Brevibacterium yomogidense TaxID=946573 RepID=UPI0018E00BF2|nr:crosslink repair DNA glycosylase YcaQ family protein [Brevibacterium yomogidense]